MVSDSGLARRVRRAGARQLSITVRFPLMSEAELHMLRARLRGGILNQARRGALKMPLPVGLVYDPLGRVVLDPDAQVQHSVRLLFDTFTRTGSATATVKHFRDEKLRFPRRPRGGAHKGELHWQALRLTRVLQVLHPPPPDTRAPSRLDAAANGAVPAAVSSTDAWRVRNGRCC